MRVLYYAKDVQLLCEESARDCYLRSDLGIASVIITKGSTVGHDSKGDSYFCCT